MKKGKVIIDIFRDYIRDDSEEDLYMALLQSGEGSIKSFVNKILIFNKYFGNGKLDEILNLLKLELNDKGIDTDSKENNFSKLVEKIRNDYEESLFTENFMFETDHSWAGEGDIHFSDYNVNIVSEMSLPKFKKKCKDKKIPKKELDMLEIEFSGKL